MQMKKIIITLFIISLIVACAEKKEMLAFNKMVNEKIAEKDSLRKIYNIYLETLQQTDWTERFRNKILADNPEFKIDFSKTIDYFVVPVLVIPDSALIRNSIDMVSYFAKGMLTVDGAECYVMEDELPVATLILNDRAPFPVRPEIFMDYIRKRNIDEARKSDLCFRIAIRAHFTKTKSYRAYLPGIVFLNKENNFMFLNYRDNIIYPISEIYRSNAKNEDEFRKFINGFIERREN